MRSMNNVDPKASYWLSGRLLGQLFSCILITLRETPATYEGIGEWINNLVVHQGSQFEEYRNPEKVLGSAVVSYENRAWHGPD